MTKAAITAVACAGVEKYKLARQHPARYLAGAAVAGAFIFIGAVLSSLSAAWLYSDYLPLAKLVGAATFSAALILVVLLGGELFTGCNLVMGVALYEGRVSPAALVRVWVLAYVGNFIAILVLSVLLAGSGASRDLLGAYLAILVPPKLETAWYMLLLRGILCNFLVCIGVFAGFRVQNECAKALVIALAITTFVLCGFEHSIANMAYFALYALILPGADLAGMAWNLLWVTIGNCLGGAVLLGLPLWYWAGGNHASSQSE